MQPIYRIILPRAMTVNARSQIGTRNHRETPYQSNIIAARPGPNGIRKTMFKAPVTIRDADGRTERRRLEGGSRGPSRAGIVHEDRSNALILRTLSFVMRIHVDFSMFEPRMLSTSRRRVSGLPDWPLVPTTSSPASSGRLNWRGRHFRC
jgi:hypothetical protein